MIYLLKLKNGDEHEIGQKTRDSISNALLAGRDERPEFIEIESVGAIISTSLIATIIPYRKEPEPLLTKEQEISAFNERWERQHETR